MTEAWWPLPESFWLDQSLDTLPPRQTFPLLKIHSPHTASGIAVDSHKGASSHTLFLNYYIIIRTPSHTLSHTLFHSPSPSLIHTLTPSLSPLMCGDICNKGVDLTMHPPHQRLEAAFVYLSLAKELGVHVDTYELAPAVASPQSVKKSLGLHKNDCCHVSMQGSGQGPRGKTLQDLTTEASIGTGGGDIPGGGGSAAVDQPCAILTARSQVAGSVELVVMPYNYPVLLPLLKRILDMLKNSNIASSNIALQDQLWVSQFRKELGVYLLNIPANYYPTLLMLLKSLRLNVLTSNLQVAQNTPTTHPLIHPLPHRNTPSNTPSNAPSNAPSNTPSNTSSHPLILLSSDLQNSYDGKIHVTPFKQVKTHLSVSLTSPLLFL